MQIAEIFYYNEKYSDGLNALKNLNSVESENLRLSLYLCLNAKDEFNLLAKNSLQRMG